MSLTVTEAATAALWVSALSLGAIAWDARSTSAWLVVAGVAVVPPLLILGRRKVLATSSARSADEARR
jgi:hypothetical protein